MPDPKHSRSEADAFLEVSPQFRLGDLPTEQSHPASRNLSDLVTQDLDAAFAAFKKIDRAALTMLRGQSQRISELSGVIADVLVSGNRIFMAGCGATGRLALTVEALCREGLVSEKYQDRIVGFMAGGDAALVRSLEGFEDREDYARRQVEAVGFSEGDLMIGITEGGETPFVIACVEAALETSQCTGWFCYCNPNDILKKVAERSKRILENPRVAKLPLLTGPMALSGSTRLQAITVQLAAMLIALECLDHPDEVSAKIDTLADALEVLDYACMAPFTRVEFSAIENGDNIVYQTNDYGLTVLTDTTERSPTFSMNAFENQQNAEHPASLCYLSIPNAPRSEDAWQAILHRQPRTLEWDEVSRNAGYAYLLGYDISAHAPIHREQKMGRAPTFFQIENTTEGVRFSFKGEALEVALPRSPGVRNLALKVLLNAHSTLLAGLLGRYEGNWMTWVKPSNLKLIDRAIRYIRQILEARGYPDPGYETVCYALFEVRSDLKPNGSIVLKTAERLVKSHA